MKVIPVEYMTPSMRTRRMGTWKVSGGLSLWKRSTLGTTAMMLSSHLEGEEGGGGRRERRREEGGE